MITVIINFLPFAIKLASNPPADIINPPTKIPINQTITTTVITILIKPHKSLGKALAIVVLLPATLASVDLLIQLPTNGISVLSLIPHEQLSVAEAPIPAVVDHPLVDHPLCANTLLPQKAILSTLKTKAESKRVFIGYAIKEVRIRLSSAPSICSPCVCIIAPISLPLPVRRSSSHSSCCLAIINALSCASSSCVGR